MGSAALGAGEQYMAAAPGDWSEDACRTVAAELTASLDLGAHRDAAVDTAVWMHFHTSEVGARSHTWRGIRFRASPQHLLALLHGLRAILTQQREALEDQQRFRIGGLEKLAATVDRVEALQATLSTTQARLERTNAEANERLQRMVQDQQAGEQKKQASIELQAELAAQEKEVATRHDAVLRQLAEAEPAVLDAQTAVSGINKQHLSEVRSMGNPPSPVKSTMESVCMLLGHKVDSWKSVQQVLRREDFISSVVRLDTSSISRSTKDQLQNDFLTRPDYNYDTINRASKACGPLANWVIAQVHYADILERIGPLRAEVASLEAQVHATAERGADTMRVIAELEASIATSKSEYAALISEIQTLKAEMESVQTRVDRSVQLMQGLSSERARWEAASASFADSVQTLVGNALMCAAFLAYGGFFEQVQRETLWDQWQSRLSASGVPTVTPLSFVAAMSTADTRALWYEAGLPQDALCTENAIVLHRATRYPYIVDPSAQITPILQKLHAGKMTVTSFLDGGFVHVFENALRFGHRILIQDAEHFDPIVMPVLNRELRRVGGRVLVRVGQQDVDIAPSFTLLLATRNASADIPPHVFSRVAVVNFTMTRKSLQSQVLDMLLRVERPDIDARRTSLLQMQHELHSRTRHLEQMLLTALHDAQGDILSDDKVISTLESLKAEADTVAARVAENEQSVREINSTTQVYEPLARECSAIYFTLDGLAVLRPYYQFDLAFFLRIMHSVLAKGECAADGRGRLDHLRREFFLETIRRAGAALLHEDRVILLALLAQTYGGDALEGEEYTALISGSAAPAPLQHSTEGAASVLDASADVAFLSVAAKHVRRYPDTWGVWLSSEAPETLQPPVFKETDTDDISAAVRHALLVEVLRPDRVVPALMRVFSRVFGGPQDQSTALSALPRETEPTIPIALGCVAGYDASFQIEQLVAAERRACAFVALGSPEALSDAERELASAARTGSWVVLKNAHLARDWIAQLVPRVSALQPHEDMRVFVTLEMNASAPTLFVRASRVLMYEPPAGLKAALLGALQSLDTRPASGPAERERLYFLAAFLHATLVERVRYIPLGWTKMYEFYDSDFAAALDVIDDVVQDAAHGKAHVDPAQLPWDALRALLKQAVYGGKIDSTNDRDVLDAFVDHLFSPDAFDRDFVLAPDAGAPLPSPDALSRAQYIAWAERLPEPVPVQWLMLAPAAERAAATAHGQAVIARLTRIRETGVADSVAASERDAAGDQQRLGAWLDQLPETLTPPPSVEEEGPLERFWRREYETANLLLQRVRSNLAEAHALCSGGVKRTNENVELLHSLLADQVPLNWRVASEPRRESVDAWLAGFHARLAQLTQLAAGDLRTDRVALGQMFSPSAFLTATRQAEARRQQVSLEALKLELVLGDIVDAGSFALKNFWVEGADWTGRHLAMNEGASAFVPRATISWMQRPEQRGAPLPVFASADRSEKLFTANLPLEGAPAVQRGIAIRVA